MDGFWQNCCFFLSGRKFSLQLCALISNWKLRRIFCWACTEVKTRYQKEEGLLLPLFNKSMNLAKEDLDTSTPHARPIDSVWREHRLQLGGDQVALTLRRLLVVGMQAQSPGRHQALREVFIALSDLVLMPFEVLLTRQCQWELCASQGRRWTPDEETAN